MAAEDNEPVAEDMEERNCCMEAAVVGTVVEDEAVVAEVGGGEGKMRRVEGFALKRSCAVERE